MNPTQRSLLKNRSLMRSGGMEVSDVRRLRELEDENRRLKHIVAELTIVDTFSKKALSVEVDFSIPGERVTRVLVGWKSTMRSGLTAL